MKFKKTFINSIIFLGLSIFITNAKMRPKSDMQFRSDTIKAAHKIISITNANLDFARQICQKILSDQHSLHDKYDDFLSDEPIYLNPDFIKEQRLWAENYDSMNFPGFSELVEALHRHSIDGISQANTHILCIYTELESYFENH